MGLDQSLRAKKKGSETSENDYKFAYWRKAGWLREWLITTGNIEPDDNCQPRVIESDELELLLELCNSVLADHSKADSLLPVPESGFFFGKYQGDKDAYDEYYFEQVEHTAEEVERAITYLDENEDMEVYYSDWW